MTGQGYTLWHWQDQEFLLAESLILNLLDHIPSCILHTLNLSERSGYLPHRSLADEVPVEMQRISPSQEGFVQYVKYLALRLLQS